MAMNNEVYDTLDSIYIQRDFELGLELYSGSVSIA